jgi:ferredoxin--NADP+ reductase
MSSSDEKFYRTRITKRVDVAPDLWRIYIDRSGFHFLPGQYATLGLEGSNRRVERAYSIVSSPYEEELEFFVELVPQGELTPQLYDLQLGDELLMRKVAKGRFLFDALGVRSNHLLVSTVTGVAPFLSYLRTLFRDFIEGRFPLGHQLYLLNGASRSWEFGYHEEIQNLAKSCPWLTYVPTVSRPWEDQNWKGEVGRVDDVLRKYVDMWGLTGQNTVAYLCGHPEMIEHGKGILRRSGFAKEALREETYWIPAKKQVAA